MSFAKLPSVRIPVEHVESVVGRSEVAPLIVDPAPQKLGRLREAEIEESLKCLAGDAEGNDISDWAPFQAEVDIDGPGLE